MEESSGKIDTVGFIGLIVVVSVVALGLYWLIMNWEIFGSEAAEKFKVMDTSKPDASPGPVNTEAPFSNAPVQGQAKEIIVPVKFEQVSAERTSNFTFPKKAVVRWDLIPMTANMVTVGFRMSNPPLTGRDPKFMKYVISTEPASSGISVSLPGRGDYNISAGGHNMKYIRDTSAFNMTSETVEIRFTQVSDFNTRVEVIYNGKDKVIAGDKHIPISTIRGWPQQLKVFNPAKIENIWVDYAR